MKARVRQANEEVVAARVVLLSWGVSIRLSVTLCCQEYYETSDHVEELHNRGKPIPSQLQHKFDALKIKFASKLHVQDMIVDRDTFYEVLSCVV